MVSFSEDGLAQASLQRDNVVSSDHISFLKFKYELQNLFASIKTLRDKELCSRQEFLSFMEKHKKLEAEHSEAYSVMQSEISSGKESLQKLESTISDLRYEASTRESEIKHLKQELKALMDSRNEMAEDLKSLNYKLECELQERTHDLAILIEKHERHSILLEAVENEACLVRQSVNETNLCIKEKEEEVMGLTRVVSKVLGFEGAFLEKISQLEQQARDSSAHILERNKLIMSLEEKLAATSTHALERENLEMKSNLILKMRQEKKVLLEDLENLETMIGRLQKAVTQQDEAMEEEKQVLTLSKRVHTLTENLAQMEQKLASAIDENANLTKKLEEQKSEFITQTELWEAEKNKYEERICSLEARVVGYGSLFFNTVSNEQPIVMEGSLLSDAKTCKLQLVRNEGGEQETRKISFSSTEYLDDIIFPGQMQPLETRLDISTKQIRDENSVTRLDLKKNNSRNIRSIFERLGRPLNIVGMKRTGINKPITIVLHKSTSPARQIMPDIVQFNELMNRHGSVVLGIKFGPRENRNQYLNVLRAAEVHESDKCDYGNSNRGSCIDLDEQHEVSTDGGSLDGANDIKHECV